MLNYWTAVTLRFDLEFKKPRTRNNCRVKVILIKPKPFFEPSVNYRLAFGEKGDLEVSKDKGIKRDERITRVRDEQ
ncbi:hypothetical protein P5673_029496 [Acropora cervicornis]|uniref:Uncharacterized protein n=1 Tax=Acropora cervicornis TaxID=6130 RepID=A0AAD9PVL9_ACRCE|nr:hypothetical protein P5673_029496 [Acropora cervicornis]